MYVRDTATQTVGYADLQPSISEERMFNILDKLKPTSTGIDLHHACMVSETCRSDFLQTPSKPYQPFI